MSSSTSWGVSTAVGSSRIRIFAPPVEGLHDLHPLHLTHRELIDPGVQVQLEGIAVQDLLDLPAGGLPVDERPLLRLVAQNDVLEHAEGRGQHEVLVYHADPQGDGLPGGVDLDLFPVDPDGPGGGTLHTIQLVHDGGLAGAVFPHEAVDLSLPDRERDMVVGQNTGVLLDDVDHFYCVHGTHRTFILG